MPALSDYVSGTITLTNGSNAFTGTGTGWEAADFREGDTILGIEDHAGVEYVIASIDGNGSGTLTQNWEGATGTYTYRMRYMADGARVTAQARNLIELLGNGNLQALAGLTGPGVPVFNGPHAMEIKPVTDFVNGVTYNVQVDTLADRAAYDGQSEGFSVLVSDVGDGRSALFSKASNTSGDWTDPAYITGPSVSVTVGTTTEGPFGSSPDVTGVTGAGSLQLNFELPGSPSIDATVTSLPPGTTASVVTTPVAGGYELDFELPEARGFYNVGVYDIAEAYSQDDVVRHNGSSFIALQAVPAGTSPSNAFPPTDTAYWQVLAAKGADGEIEGVTPFWQERLLGDENASAAKEGLEIFDGVRPLSSVTNQNPIYIAHRNQALLYPDQSLGAFRKSAESDLVDALECDVRKLSDGTLVNFHDTTLQRVTSSTGNVETLTAEQYRNLYIDAENWHGSNVPDGSVVTEFAQVLREFRGKKLFMPEIKTLGAGPDVTTALLSANIPLDHAVVSSFNLADLTAPLAAGYPVMFTTSTASDIAAAQAAGVTWVALQDTENDSIVTDWVSAGFKVVMWTVNRRHRRDHLLGLGVVGFYTDDVEYLAREEPFSTKDDWKKSTWMPGMLSNDGGYAVESRGRFQNGGFGLTKSKTYLPPPDAPIGTFILQGWASPIGGKENNNSFSIDYTATYLSSGPNSPTQSWAAIAMADSSMLDRPILDAGTGTVNPSPASEKFINFLFRNNGHIDIYKRTGTDAPRLVRAESPPLAVGETARLRIIVTPTTLSFQRIGSNGDVISEAVSTDTEFRGGYIHTGFRNDGCWLINDLTTTDGPTVLPTPVGGETGSFNKSNIIGTVSQSAGVPTGAVVERGSNANGDYVRFADGTQICTGRITNFTVVPNTATAVPVIFPASFLNNLNSVSVTPQTASPASYEPPTSGGETSSGCNIYIHRIGSTASAYFTWIVIGRWF